MKEISVTEFKKLKDEKADFQLIDVREPFEAEIAQMGGQLIPMGTIADHLDEISKQKQVIIHCKSGRRSATICQYLEQHGFENVYNLKGGILAYAAEIDASIPSY